MTGCNKIRPRAMPPTTIPSWLTSCPARVLGPPSKRWRGPLERWPQPLQFQGKHPRSNRHLPQGPLPNPSAMSPVSFWPPSEARYFTMQVARTHSESQRRIEWLIPRPAKRSPQESVRPSAASPVERLPVGNHRHSLHPNHSQLVMCQVSLWPQRAARYSTRPAAETPSAFRRRTVWPTHRPARRWPRANALRSVVIPVVELIVGQSVVGAGATVTHRNPV